MPQDVGPLRARARAITLCCFAFILGLSAAPARAQFDASAPEPIAPIPGALVISGGGSNPVDAYDEFFRLAGGAQARIVVLPGASIKADDGDFTVWTHPWTERGAADVQVLHTRDRNQARLPEFSAPLDQATGVWIGGGKQSRLADAFLGTEVETRLHALLQRGGVIGGHSAGAAVMSRTMIAAGRTEADLERGFGFLPGVIIDQHFTERKRLARLYDALSFEARHRSLVGLGVDEGTAVIIRGRRLRVLGRGGATICYGALPDDPPSSRRLVPGETADLIALSRAAQSRAAGRVPRAEPGRPEVPRGTLVIVGGGRLPREVLARFIAAAGGPEAKIVYVPCEEAAQIDREPGMVELFRQAGVKHVSWIHTKDRSRADLDEEFLAPLQDATGVWFGGGRQWNLVDSYLHTRAHQLMHAVLERGGAIGGSSAGASIQGEYMCRGNPLGNREIIAPGYEEGMGFLPGVAIDQHFTQRGRQPDMSFLMRTHPQYLGLGLDEGAAAIVSGSTAEVMGLGGAYFYDARRDEDQPEFDRLVAGAKYDLLTRRPLNPSLAATTTDPASATDPSVPGATGAGGAPTQSEAPEPQTQPSPQGEPRASTP